MIKTITCVCVLFFSAITHAELSLYEKYRAQINKGSVGIVGGSVAGTYSRFAQDLSNAIDDIGTSRIVAVLGKGSQQNILDLLFLKQIDMAIVQSDVLEAMTQKAPIPNIKDKIKYITKLYNEEVHILVKKDIFTVKQLSGEKVSIGTSGSGTNMTGRIVFDALDIPVEFVNQDFLSGKDALLRGEVAALVYVAGKPVSGLASIKESDGLSLLNFEIDKSLSDSGYIATEFTPEDYPNLITSATNTIAVGAVLAVYDWKESKDGIRYKKAKAMTSKILNTLPKLKESRFHAKWHDVDPFEDLPSWERSIHAKNWITQNR